MTAILNDPEALTAEAAPRARRGGFLLETIRHSLAAQIGIGLLVFFVLVAVFAPVIAPYSTTQQVGPVYAPPSLAHPFGLDDGGIDLLSLLIYGARISLIVGFAASLVSMVLGGGIGIISGYFTGTTDVVLMRLTDYFIVIPDIVLMIVIAAIWGPSLFHIILVIGILLWASTARVIRAQVKSVRERVYVRRVRAIGAGHWRTVALHVLPQIAPLLIANTVLTIAVAIFDETVLDFFGLGDPSSVTWGTIIEHAFDRTAISAGAWWAIVPAGICVALVIMGCYLLGQAMEEALNPRLKSGHLSVRRFTMRPLVGRGPNAV